VSATDWRIRARCREIGTDVFYPESSEDTEMVDAAKSICEVCPVKPQCLEEALDTREVYGIWGGTSAWQRRALHRQRGQGVAA
jgi:WhiB family redox-sensing transcriptional regulator